MQESFNGPFLKDRTICVYLCINSKNIHLSPYREHGLTKCIYLFFQDLNKIMAKYTINVKTHGIVTEAIETHY